MAQKRDIEELKKVLRRPDETKLEALWRAEQKADEWIAFYARQGTGTEPAGSAEDIVQAAIDFMNRPPTPPPAAPLNTPPRRDEEWRKFAREEIRRPPPQAFFPRPRPAPVRPPLRKSRMHTLIKAAALVFFGLITFQVHRAFTAEPKVVTPAHRKVIERDDARRAKLPTPAQRAGKPAVDKNEIEKTVRAMCPPAHRINIWDIAHKTTSLDCLEFKRRYEVEIQIPGALVASTPMNLLRSSETWREDPDKYRALVDKIPGQVNMLAPFMKAWVLFETTEGFPVCLIEMRDGKRWWTACSKLEEI